MNLANYGSKHKSIYVNAKLARINQIDLSCFCNVFACLRISGGNEKFLG